MNYKGTDNSHFTIFSENTINVDYPYSTIYIFIWQMAIDSENA